MVKSQPLPIPWMMGDVTRVPTQEKMLRTKLLSATPVDDFFGMNSVSIVVAMLKISMDPTPKKKLAIICLSVRYFPRLQLFLHRARGFIPGQARIHLCQQSSHTTATPLGRGMRQARHFPAYDLQDGRPACHSRRTCSPFWPRVA